MKNTALMSVLGSNHSMRSLSAVFVIRYPQLLHLSYYLRVGIAFIDVHTYGILKIKFTSQLQAIN